MSGSMRRMALSLLLAVTSLCLLASPAAACDTEGGAGVDGILVESECLGGATQTVGDADPGSPSAAPYANYAWASVCGAFEPTDPRGFQSVDCAAARNCPDPAERVWQLWGERRPPEAGWELLGAQCFGRPPGPGDTPQPPTIGPGDVLTALRRIGLPALEAKTQPADKTLVNFATIFYAEPEPFTRTIRLLGQRVDVEATPATYTWHHGDGTTAQTSDPGAPYPAKDVTHDYTDAHVTVRPRVDVTYIARFRVNGGPWQDIAERVTIAGPEGELRIAEATAVLSGQYQ